MHSSADDVNQEPPSPVTKAPDIGPHLNTFNTFGYQIASGMVRDKFQLQQGGVRVHCTLMYIECFLLHILCAIN